MSSSSTTQQQQQSAGASGSGMEAVLSNLTKTFDIINSNIDLLTSNQLPEHTHKLPLLDRAKLNVLISHAINSLFFTYLKLSGVPPQQHAVKTEIIRLKSYFNKLKQASGIKDKPSLKVDKAAAKRFVTSGVGSSSSNNMEKTASSSTTASNTATNATANTSSNSPSAKKRKRPTMDPFTGKPMNESPKSANDEDASSKKRKQSKK